MAGKWLALGEDFSASLCPSAIYSLRFRRIKSAIIWLFCRSTAFCVCSVAVHNFNCFTARSSSASLLANSPSFVASSTRSCFKEGRMTPMPTQNPTTNDNNPISKVYILASLALLFIVAAGGGVLFSLSPLHAQSTNASLTGRITDSSKGVVPNVLVVAINTGTRIHYETVTNATGSYYVTDLPPGTYRIEVEKVGFKAVIKSDLVLHVQDALEINFEMVLGSASESVTVRGGVPPLDTESSTIGTVVEQRKVNELPLNGRNVFNLIELAASVVPQGSSTGTPVGVNPFGWGNYQVNGSFGNESAEFLDGQPLNIGYINLPILIPTQDSIQEFKVQTSNLGPEWGKFSGGVINLSTKAGASSIHGEAYEYLRNKIFNANDTRTPR